ncbi:MAG: PQ-loop repeat-containing protein, partial [Methylococcaceae bacterium]|nr:PQ-loop repeat-containing protein [Methylococcaceae bacterium]
MSQIDILGLIASGFTITSFMPQIWRTWRTRDVSGMSLPTYIIMTTGTTLW